jgi:hemoglobin-like flavoprotein
MQAWEKAYGIIAEAFIGIEKDMYNGYIVPLQIQEAKSRHSV